ncbi:Scr1 family TA system antitoxin-like transcriptional regulator [Streptomyces canus]|uniref:helix-turn-helix domain-containing protein n=1 Tax=Streptomyces canus TaxID=58343 RepID=UPI002E29F2C1|nr:Scr1 family TA system antitoxin-like transcriptional regulator [Streptomyces canus]
MAIEDNPLTRQQYGAELKRRREAAGLTQEELSVRAVMSRTHIAHIEAGRRRPDVEDARRLDQVLETGGFFENFLPTLDGRKVAEHFAEALEFEGRATEKSGSTPQVGARHLQTPAYTREVLSSGAGPKSDDERDGLLVSRLERARVLDDFHSPKVWILLDEAVLQRPIGSPEVMCEQLRHIANLGESKCGSRTCRPSPMPKAPGRAGPFNSRPWPGSARCPTTMRWATPCRTASRH